MIKWADYLARAVILGAVFAGLFSLISCASLEGALRKARTQWPGARVTCEVGATFKTTCIVETDDTTLLVDCDSGGCSVRVSVPVGESDD